MKSEPLQKSNLPVASTPLAQGRVLRDVESQSRPLGLGRRGLAGGANTVKGSFHQGTGAIVDSGNSVSGSAARPGGHATSDNAAREEQAFLDGVRRGHAEGFQEAKRTVESEAQQAGYRAGYDEGVQEGLAAGRLKAEQELESRARAIQTAAELRVEQFDQLFGGLLKQFDLTLSRRLDAAEDDMVALTHASICRLLGAHALDANVVMQTVREAIEQWLKAGNERVGNQSLTIHMNPFDLKVLEEDAQLSLWVSRQHERGMRWQADDAVELGGCLIKGHQGSLDARLETQLHELTAVLSQGRHSTGITHPAVSALGDES